MSGPDSRAARVALTILLIAAALAALYAIRSTLLLFVFALFLAYVLTPLVGFVDRFASGRASRTISLAVVYLALLAIVTLLFGYAGSIAAHQASTLAARLPDLLSNPQQIQLPIPEWIKPYQAAIERTLREQLESHADQIVPMLATAGKGALAAAGNLIFVILVPILSFFFLKDGQDLLKMFLDQFPPERRAMASDIVHDIHTMLSRFVRAMILLCLATFVTFAAALAILGVPYSMLLALVAGAVEFVPVAGPLIAAGTILIVAGFSGYPHMLWVVIFLIAYRLVLDYTLQPYLLGRGVALPPLAIIFGVLAGEQMAGILGMLLSIPALAILRVLYLRYRDARAGAHA